MASLENICIVVDIQVNLSLWQACKLRIAGARYLEKYVEHMIAMQASVQDMDDDEE